MPSKISFFFIVLLSFMHAMCKNTSTGNDTLLTIYDHKVPCMGENVRLCYKVRANGGAPEFFYDDIEGFEYRWGFTYTLCVEKTGRRNGLQGSSSFAYRLKKVVAIQKAPAGEVFELPLTLEDENLIKSENGSCTYLNEIVIQTGKYSCEDLRKARFASFTHSDVTRALVLKELR